MQSEPRPDGLEQFKQMVTTLGVPFSQAGLSYHAKRGESGLIILHARIFLRELPIGLPSRFVRFLDQQVGFFPLSELGAGVVEIVERMAGGDSIDTPHGALRFPLAGDSSAQMHFRPLHDATLSSGTRLAVLIVSGAALPHHRFSLELNWELKASDPPYDSLGELLNEFMLGGYDGDLSCIEVSIPNFAEVDLKSQVSGSVAKPGVMLPPGLDRTPLSLGILLYHQGAAVKRVVLRGDQLTWSQREGPPTPKHQLGIGTVEIPVGAALKCIAVYNGIAQHEGWIGDPDAFPNWRRTVYERADSGCEVMRDFLFEDKKARRKEGGDFEEGVASLMWILGFGVLHLRSPRMHDNPDLLLTTPHGRLVLVECTTGIIDNDDKLAKLHARARSLKSQLEKAGQGYIELVPVLVTALPTASVVDIDKAARFGIVVVTQEGLRSAFERSIVPVDPDALVTEQQQLLLATRRQFEDEPA